MNSAGHFSNAFLSNFLDEKSVLEKNVADYPASPFARVLLWNHYKKTNDAGLEKFTKQSALFFNNPAWIEFQLFHHALPEREQELPTNTATEHFAVTIPAWPAADELPEERTNQNDEEQEFQKEETTEENVANGENESEENLIPLETGETISVEDSLPKSFAENENNDVSISPTSEENIIENIPDSQLDANDALLEIQDTAKQEVNPDQIKENEDELTKNPEKEQSSFVGLSVVNSDDKASDEFTFEPLHTVDYFASQGIKIREELLLDDKLGKQMKSFTEWLKSMKKLHPGKLPEQNEVIERIIQTSAEESNADAEVLTEAMADVLLKQDKKQKAIEMYEKLSLINPSKSTYFAAKIESIKTL